MIKETFNRHYPIDKKKIANIGRYSIVRGSYPNGNGDPACKYGIFLPSSDLTPLTDMGIALSYEEIIQLADMLPKLIEKGAIRPSTPKVEYDAFVDADKKAKEEAARQRRVW